MQDCEAVSNHPDLRLAIRLQDLLASHCWVSYYKETQRAPYLLACAAHLYYPWLRAHAFNVIKDTQAGESSSSQNPPVPLGGEKLLQTRSNSSNQMGRTH